MKKQIFTLLTFLVVCVTGAWATDITWDFTGYDSKVTLTSGTSYSYEANDGATEMRYTAGSSDEITAISGTTPSYLKENGNTGGGSYKDIDGSTAIGKNRLIRLFVTGKGKITINCKSSNVGVYKVYEASTTSIVAASSTVLINSYTANAQSNEITVTKGLWIETTTKGYIHSIVWSPSPTCSPISAPTDLSCTAQTKNSLTFSWTAAANASKYAVTLYSDSECTSEVASDGNVTSTSKTFTGLNGSSTYYCKVQSIGNGTTYCEEGGVTKAASGTTLGKDYTITVGVNNEDMGSVSPTSGSMDAGDELEITATPNSGYKFRGWAVSGEGSTLSSTTANPTTLTMGTADATVTATFSALAHYTITYNKGAYGAGDDIAAGDKTEDAAFALSSTRYTRDGYVQTGWALTDGGDKAYDLGGSYTGNANLDLYPFWTVAYTLSYNGNGGSGSMADTKGVGGITLPTNAFAKSGYSFMGWATSKANADAGTVAYADGAAYTLSADATLYAVWGESYCNLVPAISGSTINSGDVINMQSGSFGGSMKALSSNLSYNTYGLQFGTNSNTKASVSLNDYIKVGTIIAVKLTSNGTSARGLHLYTSDGETKITTLGWSTSPANGDVKVFQYEVKAGDAIIGAKEFQLWRNNTVTMAYLAVVNAQPGATISSTGWATYSSNKALDLSTISNGEAFVATSTSGNDVVLSPCTGIVAAGTGLMIKGESGDKFTIDATSSSPNFSGTNLLVGCPAATVLSTNASHYVMVSNGGVAEFQSLKNNGATIPAGKAYLDLTSLGGAPDRMRIVEAENGATDVNNIEANEKAVKFMENGQIYILRDGVVYDAVGRVIRK